MNEQTFDITEPIPTLEPETRTKVKKMVFIGIAAVGILLLIDDQVKKFKTKKSVEVTVTDLPSS